MTINNTASKPTAPIPGGPGVMRGPIPVRGPVPARGPPFVPGRAAPPHLQKPVATEKTILQHIGVRPSIQNALPTISTGSSGLDSILGHVGLPLGSVLMLEETGNTDYASVLLRSFSALGVNQSRVGDGKPVPEGPNETKIIAVGVPSSWASELPGMYIESKEKKKLKIKEQEKKLTVGNVLNNNEKASNMTIAWRYANQSQATKGISNDESKPYYSTFLDYRSRISPSPSPLEVESIDIDEIVSTKTSSIFNSLLSRLISSVESSIKKSPTTVIRIVIPSLLHPLIYPRECATQKEFILLVHGLVALCRKYTQNVAIMLSISEDLYPRELSIIRRAELLVDGVIHIEPFTEDLQSTSSEAPSNSSENKPYQGLVNIYKLPVLSERGQMEARRGEFAFRVGRKSFEIEPWGIPVEELLEKPAPVESNASSHSETNALSGQEVDMTTSSSSATSTQPKVDLRKLDF